MPALRIASASVSSRRTAPVAATSTEAMGGFFGGKVLGPMFAAAGPPSSDFAMLPFTLALVTALIVVVAADQTLKRWDL